MKNIKILSLFFSLLSTIFFQSFSFGIIKKDYKDPLPSWNEGNAKIKIIEFVNNVTDSNHKDFVEINQRIATLDLDGTIFCEHPINFQRAISLERLREIAHQNQSLITNNPYKGAVEFDYNYQADSNNHNEIFLTAFNNYSLENYYDYCKEYMINKKQYPLNLTFENLYYQPGIELINYLTKNNFKVYICSTTEENCIRVLLEKCLNLEHINIIGNEVDLEFSILNGKSNFRMGNKFRKPENRENYKCVYIVNQIGGFGKPPIFAFGNSTGDLGMLRFTNSSDNKNLVLVLDHDDPIREFEYHSNELLDEAKKNNWQIVSMKNDFKQIFKSI